MSLAKDLERWRLAIAPAEAWERWRFPQDDLVVALIDQFEAAGSDAEKLAVADRLFALLERREHQPAEKAVEKDQGLS